MIESVNDSAALSYTLASTLLEKGILSLDQLDVLYKEQSLSKASFEECLLKLGFLSEGALAEVIESVSGLERVNLKQALLDPSFLEKWPIDISSSLFPGKGAS